MSSLVNKNLLSAILILSVLELRINRVITMEKKAFLEYVIENPLSKIDLRDFRGT